MLRRMPYGIAALSLLLLAWHGGRRQDLSGRVASTLGMLQGDLDADGSTEGSFLGDVTVWRFPAAPARSMRFQLELESARPRDLVLTCPDGIRRQISLEARRPTTLGCEWNPEGGGEVRVWRRRGRGWVLAHRMMIETSGMNLHKSNLPWLVSLGVLAWWIARRSQYPRGSAAALFLVATATLILAPRVEILVPLIALWLPLAILQTSRSVAVHSGHWAAGAVTFAMLTKLAFAANYAGGDIVFHTHMLQDFAGGKTLTSSMAPLNGNRLPIPYPPGAYALLSPFVGLAADQAPHLVGIALWTSEALNALLVAAIARKSGLPLTTSWNAAALYAVLPEGVLVIFKAIFANLAGQTWALLAILFLIPPISMAGLTFATGMVFLTHPGVTMNFGMFLAAWALRAPWVELRAMVASVSTAAVTAWALYYRSAWDVTMHATTSVSSSLWSLSTVLAQHPLIRAGKIAQNVVFKLGGLPLLTWAWRDALPSNTRRLLHAGVSTYLVAALAAIGTPFVMRFELFTAPVFCILAAAFLNDSTTRRAAFGIAAFTALVYALVATGRVDFISFILESPRWYILRDLGALLPQARP